MDVISISLIPVFSLFRRWWGGWFAPNSAVKRIVGFLLPFVAALYTTEHLIVSFIIGIICLVAWLMPYHGYGISMGRDPVKPLWKCILVMGFQYGLASLVICGVKFGFGYGFGIPLGFLVPFGYWIGWKIFPDGANIGEYPEKNVFIDGAGAIGEFFLGALMGGTILYV